MADLASLQARRAQLIALIHSKGGKDKAPRAFAELNQIENQIYSLKNKGATPPGATPPGATPPATTEDVKQGQTEIAKAGGEAALANLQGSQLNTAFNPTLTPEYLSGDLAADRARVEADVYGRLTTGLQDQYNQRRQQAEQTLRNRGIPFSADPNSRYQQELGVLDRQYADQQLAARQTATGIGLQEQQGQFGMNQTQRQNQWNTQAGTRNQQLGEIQGLSTLGVPGVLSFEQLSQADKDRLLQEAMGKLQAKTAVTVAGINNQPKPRSGGGSGNEDSPFNTGM